MKKRIGIAVLTALLLVLLAAMTQALADDYAVVHDTNTLNLRAGPDSSTALLGSANRGDWVQILGENGNWYYVRVVNGGKYGYMSKNYLSTGASSSSLRGVVANAKSTSYLNLRARPSTGSASLAKYHNGAVCEILDAYTPGWYHVRIDGMEGYFSSQFLRLESPVYSDRGTAYVATNNGGKLKMRSGPTTNAGVLTTYSNGTAVSVILKGNGFWKVSVGGKVGYMDASFLSASGPVTPVGPTGNAYCIVNNSKSTSVLNLRASASTNSKSLAQYKNGTRLEVLMAGTEWCRVKNPSDGKTGYVMTKYVRLYNASSVRTVKNGNTYVNLRSRASKSGTVYARVNSGRTVTVLVPGSDWCKVKYNGTTGYMMTRYLK